MNILFTTNESYAQHAAVCIYSLSINNKDINFNIKVASTDLSEESKDRLISLARTLKIELDIIDFDISKFSEWPQIGNYSKDVYTRLWVDDFFCNSDSYVLYIDADTIVVDSLIQLSEFNLENALFAAVDIPGADSHHRCHLPNEYNYFNSGVLLFNLKKWRSEDARIKIKNFLIQNKKIATCPDQDALNGCFYEQRKALDYTYNAITPFFKKNSYENILESNEIRRVRREVKIIHFNGTSRPWNYACTHPYQEQYIKYLKNTPWHYNNPRPKSILEFIKKQVRLLTGIDSFIKLKNLKGN